MNPLVSYVRFLCFQEYDASVIVTSPNVPYKGTCSYVDIDFENLLTWSRGSLFFNFAFLF